MTDLLGPLLLGLAIGFAVVSAYLALRPRP